MQLAGAPPEDLDGVEACEDLLSLAQLHRRDGLAEQDRAVVFLASVAQHQRRHRPAPSDGQLDRGAVCLLVVGGGAGGRRGVHADVPVGRERHGPGDGGGDSDAQLHPSAGKLAKEARPGDAEGVGAAPGNDEHDPPLFVEAQRGGLGVEGDLRQGDPGELEGDRDRSVAHGSDGQLAGDAHLPASHLAGVARGGDLPQLERPGVGPAGGGEELGEGGAVHEHRLPRRIDNVTDVAVGDVQVRRRLFRPPRPRRRAESPRDQDRQDSRVCLHGITPCPARDQRGLRGAARLRVWVGLRVWRALGVGAAAPGR